MQLFQLFNETFFSLDDTVEFIERISTCISGICSTCHNLTPLLLAAMIDASVKIEWNKFELQ